MDWIDMSIHYWQVAYLPFRGSRGSAWGLGELPLFSTGSGHTLWGNMWVLSVFKCELQNMRWIVFLCRRKQSYTKTVNKIHVHYKISWELTRACDGISVSFCTTTMKSPHDLFLLSTPSPFPTCQPHPSSIHDLVILIFFFTMYILHSCFLL